MKTFNIEFGYPTCDQALIALKSNVLTERKLGTKTIKIIHGYGSNGTGGKIKVAVQKELKRYVQNGTIRMYCPGEKFDSNHEEGIRIGTRYPQVKGDSDWNRDNNGITVIGF